MTDQEIRCAILKYAYNKRKAGKEFAMAVLDRISRDYKVNSKKVQSILRFLEKEGLLRNATSGKWVLHTDKVITERGIREYEEKCNADKDE